MMREPHDSGLHAARARRDPIPTGWLRRFAYRLTTHSPDISTSSGPTWTRANGSGGTAETWERAPCWLDGAIPLAWILDDAPLKTRITKYISPSSSGISGATAEVPGTVIRDAIAKRYHDMWAILLANKGADAVRATSDARALEDVVKSSALLSPCLPDAPHNWASFRWYTRDWCRCFTCTSSERKEPWPPNLARKLQAERYNFEALFHTDDLAVPTPAHAKREVVKRGEHRHGRLSLGAQLAPRPGGWTAPGPRRWSSFSIVHHGQVTDGRRVPMRGGRTRSRGRSSARSSSSCTRSSTCSQSGDPMFGSADAWRV